MLVPFTSNEDHDFFQHLEMHMRGENPPMCGRDHLSYRFVFDNDNIVAAGREWPFECKFALVSKVLNIMTFSYFLAQILLLNCND